MESFIRGLESLDQSQDTFGSLLIPIILGKLPSEMKRILLVIMEMITGIWLRYVKQSQKTFVFKKPVNYLQGRNHWHLLLHFSQGLSKNQSTSPLQRKIIPLRVLLSRLGKHVYFLSHHHIQLITAQRLLIVLHVTLLLNKRGFVWTVLDLTRFLIVNLTLNVANAERGIILVCVENKKVMLI